MKNSTIKVQMHNRKRKIPVWSIIFWIGLWLLVSMWLGKDILLPTPVAVGETLLHLLVTKEFWQAIVFSLGRIGLGFFLAMTGGILLAPLACKLWLVRDFLSLPVGVMKATPVASFIILALVWLPSRHLPVLVSFLMAFPIIYTNLCTGIETRDRKLSEMAQVFQIPFWKRMTGINLSQLLPYFNSACGVAIGMCWKAGVAAEILGLPQGSIGERLHEAKIYLEMPEMFAWTSVIIAVSILFEKLFLRLINWLSERLINQGVNQSGSTSKQEEFQGHAPEIKVKNISKTYGEQVIFEAYSQNFAAGKTTCILGKSGVGKTTLLSLLMALELPDEGVILGLDHQKISAVFQEDRLCNNLSAFLNIRMVSDAPEEKIRQALQEAGLEDAEEQPVSEFSGGMRRRVAILRGLLAPAKVLLMDEPLRGLDEETRHQMITCMNERMKGKTVLIVTHDQSDIQSFGASSIVLYAPESADVKEPVG